MENEIEKRYIEVEAEKYFLDRMSKEDLLWLQDEYLDFLERSRRIS